MLNKDSLTSVLLLAVLFSGSTATSRADDGSNPPSGSVRLPLADYLQLKQEAEDAEPREGGIVLLSRSTDVSLDPLPANDRRDGDAVAHLRIRSVFELRVHGVADAAAPLPFGASVSRADVTRTDSDDPVAAGVHRDGLVDVAFFAAVPGTYRVALEGTASLMDPLDPAFRWPAAASARDTLRIDLPAEAAWQSEGATLLEETPGEPNRRRLIFAGTGEPFTLRLRAEAAERDALVRSTVVTLADLDDDGLRIQDAVVYRVLRGSIAEHRIAVPEGRRLQPRAFTDEGEQRVDPSATTVRLERRRLLGPGAGTGEIGHALLPYETVSPAGAGTAAQRVPLPAPGLDPEPRARYLVLGSTVAADMQPAPTEAWRRVDLDDLPAELRGEVTALQPTSLWQQRDNASATFLDVHRLPPADTLDSLVWQRETTTVLTVDGSLVLRDVLEAQVGGSYLAVELPPTATLWSTSVDGIPVRPVEDAGRVLVPVGFRRETRSRIEIVSVESRAVQRGRSEIRFAAPRVDVPVLGHEWSLLLPESARYRLDESALDPVRHLPAYRIVEQGASGIAGQVVLEDDHAVPGATLTLSGQGVHRVEVTDVDGRYSFFGLQPGEYRLTAELEGFSTLEQTVWVRRGRISMPEVVLGVLAAKETIVVTSEVPTLDVGAYNQSRARQERDADESIRRRLSSRTLDSLQGAVARGVKPLPVEIPAAGKLIQLSGALPPADVWAIVDVRKR